MIEIIRGGAMNKNKVIKPKLVFWPAGDPNLFTNRSSGIQHISEEEIVQSDFEFMISVYPQMTELFDMLFENLPAENLPLLIGSNYPGWVHKYIERQLCQRGTK